MVDQVHFSFNDSMLIWETAILHITVQATSQQGIKMKAALDVAQ